MKRMVHYDPQIVKDYEDKRKMIEDAQEMARKLLDDEPFPTQEMDDSISRDRLLKIAKQKKAIEGDDSIARDKLLQIAKGIGGDDSVVRDEDLKTVTPGNRKYLKSEWEKTHGKADDIREKMGDYNLDDEPNLEAREKRSALYRNASKKLNPLSKELNMQQNSADNENDLTMRLKTEALRRILSGIQE
jgi:hypothetical protein